MINKALDMFTAGGKPVNDLSRFTALCNALDNPQKGMKFIHVAGTNGKGSVCEYLSRALVKAGFKTGKYTSPYIYKINERIQLQNKPIPDKDFNLYVNTTINAAMGLKASVEYSQFEILTAASFLYYKKKKADYVVLEAGIGGLLDCTNIVEPELCVITSIGYDHAEILGLTLTEIAQHKAGIIKTAPFIIYPVQEREAYVEIKKQQERTRAELIIPDTDLLSSEKISVYGNEFVYKGINYTSVMGGRHQALNAVTAIEALRKLEIPDEHIKTGVKLAQVPARMEIVRKNPLTILDGAHNRQGIVALKNMFHTWRVRKAVVFGMQNGKDYLGALQELATFAHYLVLTDGFAENSVSCSDLYGAAVLYGFRHEHIFTVGNAKKAVELATELCGGGVVVVTGSLRLAASVNN